MQHLEHLEPAAAQSGLSAEEAGFDARRRQQAGHALSGIGRGAQLFIECRRCLFEVGADRGGDAVGMGLQIVFEPRRDLNEVGNGARGHCHDDGGEQGEGNPPP